MTVAIVYAFSVAPGLPPVVGAPGHAVLARQLPRLAVSGLNGEVDRGVRFFPLLARSNDERRYLEPTDLLAPERILGMHGQGPGVRMVVDGRIDKDSVAVRIHDVSSGSKAYDNSLAFDPRDPLPVVRHVMFELSSALGWTGSLPQLPDLSGAALAHFLVAKDDLLGLEAGMRREDETSWLRAVARAQEHAPGSTAVQDLLLDLCRHRLVAGAQGPEVAPLLLAAAAQAGSPAFSGAVATTLRLAGCHRQSARILEGLAVGPPVDEELALEVSALLFRQQRYDEARRHLEAALALGMRGPQVLAQLLVLYQRLGQAQPRIALVDELAAMPALPPAAARIACAELVTADRLDAALAVIDRSLAAHPEDAALWLELARVRIHLGLPAGALSALETVLRCRPSATLIAEVARLRALNSQPAALAAMRAIDDACGRGELGEAIARARQLVRDHPTLAEAWLFLGVVRQRLDQPRRAIRALRRALALEPGLGEAHNRLGILLVARGRYRAGLAHLERAVTRLPNEAGPQVHLAQACFHLGRRDAAQQALAEATRLGASPALVAAVRRAFDAGSG